MSKSPSTTQKLCQRYIVHDALFELVASGGNLILTLDWANDLPLPLALLDENTIKTFIDFSQFAFQGANDTSYAN